VKTQSCHYPRYYEIYLIKNIVEIIFYKKIIFFIL
jgi:hypothetical protein